MDMDTIRKQDAKGLGRQLDELRGKLQQLRFSASANQLKDVRAIRETRRDIARILTALGEKEEQV